MTKISSTIAQRVALQPEGLVRQTPASAIAKSSCGNASKKSITRLMTVSTQPPKKPATTPSRSAEDDGHERRQEGDQQRDLGAVDDPAEDVPAERRSTPMKCSGSNGPKGNVDKGS